MPRSYKFTIQRRRGHSYELTVVGRTGEEYVCRSGQKSEDGHFTNEDAYRRAIHTASMKNQR